MADIQLWQAPNHEVQNFKEISDAIQRIDDSNLTEGQKKLRCVWQPSGVAGCSGPCG